MYQNFHRHSHFSNPVLTDSVATNEDYCKRAVELGHGIISSCEHGTQGNYRECALLAEKYGLKWRYVTEAYCVKDRHKKDNTNAHIILAAKTAKGIGDLNFALSEANLTGYYYRPRLDMELLLSLDPRDVFVTTACISGLFKYGHEDAERLILRLHAHYRDSFMLEVQYHDTDKQREVNRFLLKLYRQHGIPLIAGMDSHYILPEHGALRDLRLEANHIRYDDEDGWFLDYCADDEAVRRFQRQGVLSDALIREALDNTNVFLDFEDINLDNSRKIPTLYPDLSIAERNEKYTALVYSQWAQYKQGMTDEEKRVREDGIRYEVDTITTGEMADYFLLDYEIVKRAKENGGIITATGRGSGVSYFTNTLLGFSSVDRYDIPVEMFPDRFISADRLRSGSLPDLDLNVANVEVFADAQAEVLGEWRSAPMVAFGTLKRLSAWKMYCRANSVPFETANTVSDLLKKYELDAKHADDESAVDVHDYVPEEWHDLLEMSGQYLGMVESISPHPCGYLLCCEDIRREIGIIRINSKGGKKETVYAAFIDGATAEAFGYLKNDLLSVDVVKIIAEVYRRIGIPVPNVRELLSMTRNDPETWRMYADGLCMGLNQVEREQTREKVMRYKPRNITELAAFVAAVRPGFKSMLPVFLERQRFSYGIPAFDKLIQTREMTSSFLLFQEQAMKTMQYAGFSAPKSYDAIKAIGKKHPEKVLPLKDRFLDGFIARILEDDARCPRDKALAQTQKIWQIIEDATNYNFNSSHAVCVALDSLYCAYAKAHHSLEYYTTLLSVYAAKGDKDRIAMVKEEMRKGFGIRVTPCRFRQDNRDFYIDRDSKTISDALSSVKYVGQRVAVALHDLGVIHFSCFVDVLFTLEMSPFFDSRSTEILIRMGYFEEFGSAGTLLQVFHEFRNGDSRFSKAHVEATQEKRLNALRAIESKMPDAVIPMEEQVRFEIEHYGTVLSTFPSVRAQYAVLDVDDRYSPKLRLYNLATGSVGLMKVKKADYKEQPVFAGNMVHLLHWERRPAYQFIGGKPKKKPGVTDLWLQEYAVL